MQAILKTISCYDALPSHDVGIDTPVWVSSGDQLLTGLDACSEQFRSFYLAGQRVLVCEDIRHLEQNNPPDSGQKNHQWEGVIFLNIDQAKVGHLIKTSQWCTRHVKQEGTVIVRHEEENDANSAWHALMVYGGWKEKARADLHNSNKERSNAGFSVYQRHIPTVLWHSPLQKIRQKIGICHKRQFRMNPSSIIRLLRLTCSSLPKHPYLSEEQCSKPTDCHLNG